MKKTLLVAITSCLMGNAAMAQNTFTSALDDNAWNASKWISVMDTPIVTGRVNSRTRSADGANWFVADMVNAKKVVGAKWMTTGLGIYDLFVNGRRVGEEILKPGFTHCFKTKRAYTYDITKVMKTSKGAVNQLSVQVTPGWWADKIITPDGSNGMYGARVAFRGVVELTYADGTTELFGTDTENWKAGIAGKVKHAAIFDGEEFDAREKDGFEMVEVMKNADENKEFGGVILPTNGAEIYYRHDLALSPTRAYVWKDIEGANDKEYGKIVIEREYNKGGKMMLHKGETLVVDFGQNCAAVPSFVFKSSEGTKLSCLPSELLNDGNGAQSRGMDGPEGSVHRLNLRIHQNSIRLDYTFADGKKTEYTPRYTFFGYRFLSITATDDVEIEKVSSIPVSSITKEMEIGKITTGNELINRLISNTIWGLRSNYLSVPTDCPQRNERLGWTADTQVFTATGSYFANTDRFFHKWLHDLRDSQSDKGGFPGVAPFGQYGSGNHDYMRVGWADAGIIVPWTVWRQFGDTQVIEDSWDSMEKYMDHINATKYDHELLSAENGNYQWADWLSYEPLETCSNAAMGNNGPKAEAIEYWSYLCASYWVMDAEYMKQMAQASHRGEAVKKYDDMAQEARKYICSRFLDNNGDFKVEILNTMQTPALFLLKNHILEGSQKERVIARLRKNFEEHQNCLQTGFLGTSILMQTLTDNGMVDIAYELLFQRKNPSWLYSVDNGATTIWERWNSYMIENGMGPRGMNSFNHYAYGCVCQWLWETAAGIAVDSNPLQNGFEHIRMAPVPDKRLGSMKAEYRTNKGVIKSEWRYVDNNKKWEWIVSIPKGVNATLLCPGESEEKVVSEGRYKFVIDL